MRVLITGDFQAAWSNLDLCQQAWDEVLDYCRTDDLGAIVVNGDLKDAYNPVDVRVIKWWQKAIKQATKENLQVICNLGNHDRIGMFYEENWFPLLRDYGALCIDRGVSTFGNLILVPFRQNKEELRVLLDQAYKEANPEHTVLVFHDDVKGCRYNKISKEMDNGIEKDWLHADRYRYCVGSHIHLPQKIEPNIWYTGSPFAQDWGECNQRKGYIKVTDKGLTVLPSRIPGWFDPTWKGFYEPDSWDGAKVRVKVSCRSAIDFIHEVDRARREAKDKYRGAEVFVSAVLESASIGESDKSIRLTDTDEIKVKEYVLKTCPAEIQQEKAVKYLLSRLDSPKALRTGTGVRFISAEAKNFLSFKQLKLDWSGKGIVLVQGKNQDRLGKSNGSGKTSLLQTIPVALFGTTFKGQKHDRWAKRNSQGTASITLALEDSRKRQITIRRERRPGRLRLYVDGKEQSSGMMPQGTQGLIEEVTGFTWQTLANSVYIDQDIAKSFISGTKKERTNLLSKFQNLERFEKALVLVREDQSAADKWLRSVEESIGILEERKRGCEQRLALMQKESESRKLEWDAEVRRRNVEWKDAKYELEPKIKRLTADREQLQRRYEKLLYKCQEVNVEKVRNDERRKEVGRQIKALEAALKLSECPTCMQRVNLSLLKRLIRDKKDELHTIPIDDKRLQDVKLTLQTVEGEVDSLSMEIEPLQRSLVDKKRCLEDTRRRVLELKQKEHQGSTGRVTVKNEIKDVDGQLKAMYRYRKVHQEEQRLYEYCEKAMSRDGIPAFLNALLLGPLNVAAEYYGMLFADDDIRIRFELDNGELVPRIVNVFGGEDIEDQSTGEKALAGEIASFALREAAPKSNLLILDEPGDGLDPQVARQFARGLKTLKKKFDLIVVTTHNMAISQELQDQQGWMVTKKGGVSELVSIEGQ